MSLTLLDISPTMSPFDQEDSHEFLLGMLTKMEENSLECIGKQSDRVKDTNPIRRIFSGLVRSQGNNNFI